MWKFRSANDQGGHPYLVSLNGCKGRQTWEFDPAAGTPEQRAKVEELRANFTANKLIQHHSSDELLRLHYADKIASKKFSPPSAPLKDGDIPSPERVKEHLKGAISFYECLQQEDGHFPGVLQIPC
jgi:cycloartenol synthase